MTNPIQAAITQFDYLLNAFEAATQETCPADHGYGDKRKALFEYVRKLEAIAALAAIPVQEPDKILAKVLFHQFEDGDYEIHDIEQFPNGDANCDECVQAVIVKRDWNASPLPAVQTDYEALEREHFGDAEKRTGIYADQQSSAKDVALPDGARALQEIANHLQWWLDYNEQGHGENPVTDDMHVIPPTWPTRGVLKNWIAALLTRQAVPEGWKLVPIEPTKAMCDAFNSGITHLTFGDCYARMIAAAPVAVQSKEGD